MKTLTKAIAYRIYSFLLLYTALSLFTGNTKTAFGFSVGIEALKFVQYVAFEKIWHKIKW